MFKPKPERIYSEFSKKLQPIGRILESDEYHVWGCAPIYDDNGKVHVFFSRIPKKDIYLGWLTACEIGHAIADRPEGPYEVVGVALKGSGGDDWDGWSIHNPAVYKVDGKYMMLYRGTTACKFGKTLDELSAMRDEEYTVYLKKLLTTKRVGMAVADTLDGPWTKVPLNAPIIDKGQDEVNDWDSFCTANPAFVKTPEGKYRIYYKGWNTIDEHNKCANRMYGFAEADKLEGPYIKYENNPVIDYRIYGGNAQNEDGYVWYADGKYKMVLRDMGVFSHQDGIYIESDDGITWTEPQIAYEGGWVYFDESVYKGDKIQNRFERAQILFKDDKPEYLYLAYRGGEEKLSSGALFKINE